MKLTAGEKLFRSLYLKLLMLTVVVGIAVRIIFLCNISAPEGTGFAFSDYLVSFGLGLVNDACIATIGTIFLYLFTVTLAPQKFGRITGVILMSLLAITLLYLLCFNNALDEFNRGLSRVIKILLAYWIATFALRYFCPRIRPSWTRVWLGVIISLYVIVIFFNATSEYFFWAEFNVRYNFIAVDYLVYTNEVVGNIMESYAIVPLMTAVAIVSALTVWLLFRNDIRRATDLYETRWKLTCTPIYIALTLLSILIINFNTRFQKSANSYRNEIQANGVYKFYEAFLANELDFIRFYSTLPEYEAEDIVHRLYGSSGQNIRQIVAPDSITGRRPNIILITIESMSADFMKRYGNTDGLTPALDSLCEQSLVFDRTFATGNRTVRGLEALTLSLPPCPGQSIVKRKHNAGHSSTGQILRDNGYETYYFYGGNSYFDNMGSFFGNNGYTIVDSGDYTPEEITFRNVWGVCDEDAFNKVLSTLDDKFHGHTGNESDTAPVFAHIMTISNHRPYTYPEGRISISPESKTRAGGVMYTDYAIGRFITEARRRPWGKDAVYVIVADHCASSAGKTELPIEKYHIPALIHAPGFIEPQAVDKVISQIDIMPTLFAMLGIEYESRLFGVDVLSPEYKPRAFMATYQDLGYFTGDVLTVLSPIKRVRQFRLSPTEENPFRTLPTDSIDEDIAREATALYQTSAVWNRDLR